MHKIFRFVVSIFSRLLSYVVPVSEWIIVFHSFPFYTDNSYAVYRYLKKDTRFRCIWLYDEIVISEKITDMPTEKYRRFSLKGFWYYFRARYIFCTHGVNSFLDLHQRNKIVNLWHGMPLKCIGSIDKQSNGANPTKADYLIASSPAFQDIMSKSFNNIDKNNVFVIGQPRNDLMFENTDFYNMTKINKEHYNRIGLWLPTYRQSFIGDIRCDGVYNNNGISFLSFDDIWKLNSQLANNNDLLIVKLHPMDILQKKSFPSFSNIIVFKQNEFKVQLYPFLGSCDYLLTDYSSAWIDYEILNKPIGFVMNDIEQYGNSRGLTFDLLPNILPGPILYNMELLLEFCSKPEEYNYPRTKIFNTYRDNKATERLMDKLNIRVRSI